jgi:hypothetical protein
MYSEVNMITKKPGAVFDPNQLAVLSHIEPFTTGMDLLATRGHSSPQEQIATIENFAQQHGCLAKFPEFIPGGPVDVKKDVPGAGLVYHWQRLWSWLLHIGLVVNPPENAICLFEYERPSGEQMKGKVIHSSTHIVGEENGQWPIDFSQKVNGVPNIHLVEQLMIKAKAAGAGIQFIKVETGNGCVHIGTLKIV